MKKIVLFNHKGGVSKTTSAFHIGWMIAEMGHKVLMVDADPQCNLTALFLADGFDSYYDEVATSHNNLMDGTRVAFSGIPQPIQAVDCPKATGNDNLYLLPGHMNLSEYEAQLTFALNATTTLPSLQGIPGAFNDLIEKCANQIGAEYVLIDLNPGLSSINQDFFLISDAFIVPTNPDTFSLMALKSLSSILPRWSNWKKSNLPMFANSAYPLPEGTPKFIGELPQRFNIRNGKATTPYRHKIDDLRDVTVSVFIPQLKNCGMLFEDAQYQSAGIDINTFILQEIKDFQGLAPKSQDSNVPVFKLTDDQLGTTGAALEGQRANVQVFYQLYNEISDKIIRILS